MVIQHTVKNNRTKFDEPTKIVKEKKMQSNLSVLRKMHAFRKQNTPSKHLTLSKLNKIIFYLVRQISFISGYQMPKYNFIIYLHFSISGILVFSGR